jgi:NADPH:quinone reductase-like Zn-dependent oxidoreductase
MTSWRTSPGATGGTTSCWTWWATTHWPDSGALTPTGTLVLSGGGVYEGGSVVGPMGLFFRRRLAAPFARRRLLELPARQTRANLAALRELAESGKLAPVVERTYPLSEAAEAIRYVEVEHARAKVVVTV